MRISFAAALILCLASSIARAEDITIATYNVELFSNHFMARHFSKEKSLPKTDEVKELADAVRKANDEDNWETAQVILDPKLNPDVIVFEECCGQEDLEYFNHRWLGDSYETVIVYPGNSDRAQAVALMAKPGFKVVKKMDQYYLEKDSEKNERGDRLFARGPAFVLMQAPSGYQFWVGVTHQKSKHGNSVEVAQWRNREAKRTHQIIKELEKTGPSDVVLLGDMNDELYYQEFELQAGGDSITTLVGPPEDGLTLVTKPLVDAGRISFGGYSSDRFRSFIDHIIVTKSMKPRVGEAHVFQDGLARVSSDHYPVYVKVNVDKK